VTKTLLILGAVLLPSAARAEDDNKAAVKKQLTAMQGTWVPTKLVYNGKDMLADGKLKFRWVQTGDRVVIEGNDAVKKEYAKLKLKLDLSSNPKLVDLMVDGGTQKGSVIEGIYELKAGQLRVCARVLGKERPTEFASPSGSSVVLMVLKRE
jgi:uncharacterized protein (TIGR03067 family)